MSAQKKPDDSALSRLTAQARNEISMLAYPNVDWVRPKAGLNGVSAFDVLVVGGGQAGLSIAFSLKREGVRNVAVVDSAPAGQEGVWETFARMETLRTPKQTTGLEAGIASLSAPAWYQARYGMDAWRAIERIERPRWAEFLRWFRETTETNVINNMTCVAYSPVFNQLGDELLAVEVRPTDAESSAVTTLYARRLVLATGFDGAGAWHIPKHITDAVSPTRVSHSNGPIDFEKLRGKRVGVLGHAASAFDNAGALLEAGAASVDLCFRRESLPAINLKRAVEFTGFLKHFYDLPDQERWDVSRFCELVSEPPTQNGIDRAFAFPNFHMHSGSPWLELHDDGQAIRVRTPKDEFEFDYLVCATGSVVDFQGRPELRPLDGLVELWRHRFTPPKGNESKALGQYPYLGPGFEYLPLDASADAWLKRVHAFNFSSVPSMGPHTTSSSGHKYSVPRLIDALTRSLMLEQSDALMPALENYSVREVSLSSLTEQTR